MEPSIREVPLKEFAEGRHSCPPVGKDDLPYLDAAFLAFRGIADRTGSCFFDVDPIPELQDRSMIESFFSEKVLEMEIESLSVLEGRHFNKIPIRKKR